MGYFAGMNLANWLGRKRGADVFEITPEGTLVLEAMSELTLGMKIWTLPLTEWDPKVFEAFKPTLSHILGARCPSSDWGVRIDKWTRKWRGYIDMPGHTLGYECGGVRKSVDLGGAKLMTHEAAVLAAIKKMVEPETPHVRR